MFFTTSLPNLPVPLSGNEQRYAWRGFYVITAVKMLSRSVLKAPIRVRKVSAVIALLRHTSIVRSLLLG